MGEEILGKKLNIAILDFDDIKNPLLNAGQARATFEVAKRLVKKGHSLLVICSRFPGSADREEEGIKYKHIGLGSRFIKLNNACYFFALPFAVRKIKADIVVESFVAPISTCFSPLFTNIPVVGLPTIFEADSFSKKYHLPFIWVERFGSRFYKYFLPYTQGIAEKMLKYNPKIVYKVVSQGVGEEYFQIVPQKSEHILFLGRFDIFQKGMDLLLKAYAKVSDQIGWNLLIAGKGPDQKKLENMVEELGLGSKVKIYGPAYGQEKFELLSKSLYVAFPSRFEDFSLFSLEAVASGLPLVGFNIPGLFWAGEPVIFKSEPYDVAAYANLLLKAAAGITENTRAKCQEVAQRYSWENVTNSFESFFYEVLNKEQARKLAI